jgi:hypothetical protein
MPSKVEEYIHRWYGVTMHSAASMLIALDYGNTSFSWGRVTKTIYDVLEASCAKHLLAREVDHIRFVGGPPGNILSVEGTLLTLLVDRLLYNEAILDIRARGY